MALFTASCTFAAARSALNYYSIRYCGGCMVLLVFPELLFVNTALVIDVSAVVLTPFIPNICISPSKSKLDRLSRDWSSRSRFWESVSCLAILWVFFLSKIHYFVLNSHVSQYDLLLRTWLIKQV